MRENFYWLLRDPVSKAHHTASLLILFGLTGVVLKAMVEAHNARNLYTWPIVLLTPLGLWVMLAGMSWAEVYWVPGARDLPSWVVLGFGIAAAFFCIVVPVSTWILRGGYFGMASAWITTLCCTVAMLYAAALFYEGINPNLGKVVRHHGPVFYRLKADAAWQPLGRSRPALPVGAEVRTEEGSTVVLLLGRRNHLGLGQNTRIKITGYGEKGGLELQQGRVLGSVSQYEQAFLQVETYSAHININVALFMITLDGARNTIVAVGEGTAELAGTQPYSRVVKVGKGQASTCVPSGQPLNPRPALGQSLKDMEAFRTALENPYNQRSREATETF
ncbi:hypothetical protein LBMAG56_13680 [Verrucomicrobiota bacterium]|nr:hypothetical protein LBMAG56_13680 [Verrucomicrobiota bacterium]